MATFTKSIFASLLLGICCLVASNVQAQGSGFAPAKGFKQVNFGIELEGYGLPIYAGMDFGMGDNVTIGPRIIFERESETMPQKFDGKNYDAKSSWTFIVPSIRADYHFSGLINGITEKLDFYGGLTLGYAMWRTSYSGYTYGYDPIVGDFVVTPYEDSDSSGKAKLWAQLGGRYYFSDNWGVQLEFSTFGEDGAIGMTYRF